MQPCGEALSQLAVRDPAAVDAALGDLTRTVAGLLGSELRQKPLSLTWNTAERDLNRSTELMQRTVFRTFGADGVNLAKATAATLAELTHQTNVGLLDAARFYVEFCLLSPDIIQPILPSDPQPVTGTGKPSRFVGELRRRLRSGIPADPLTVSSRLFVRAREREAEWKNYFDTLGLQSTAGIEQSQVATHCSIKTIGFISAQHLIAGLLSRFDDDWEPVLNAYTSAIPSAKVSPGVFESLQASQWNCWLVWGPSIPFCTCEQWAGTLAFQYGYGDENNSLPAVEVPGDADAENPAVLDELARRSQAESRQAKVTALIGRLRWGPWLLRAAPTEPEDDAEQNPFAAFDRLECQDLVGAPAQRMLYTESTHLNRRADGLIFEVQKIYNPPGAFQDSAHTYFSAYRWVIFLVALSEPTEAGPRLLFRKPYPEWPVDAIGRERIRQARLWEDLLPVFVHANIADPPALRFQTQALAESALSLLRQVWTCRDQLFHRDDVAIGIRFYMVCSFDYSGCGCGLKYPLAEPLALILCERLKREADREFASSIVLPAPDETAETRPWGLQGYFSACHLPEMIADYYASVPHDRVRRNWRSTSI
jgi:hypothetical protein